MNKIKFRIALLFILAFASNQLAAASWPIWEKGKARCQVVLPSGDEKAARLAQSTLSHFLGEFYQVELPVAASAEKKGTYFVLGTPENNPTLAILVSAGLKLSTENVGDEGFQLVTHRDRKSKYIVAYGRTPRALKHACQELIFYRVQATTKGGRLDAPLNVVIKPETGYRGIYMLPCWAAHDSFESWERVLRFNSEITLNRNWFWLDGFPVAGHQGEYTNTALASDANVQRLFDMVSAEDMKIYIGGGWLNWHHQKAVGKDVEKGIAYYLDYLKAFTNFQGFYFEPTGEGKEIRDWRPEAEALRRMIRTVLERRPDFEIAIAIGMFNNAEYLKLMSEFDPQHVFWWWCWGDPLRDKALDLYPSVLRWHLSQWMSSFHGSMDPPKPCERRLTGFVTSYDPGQGYGNPWNGWDKLGVNFPRNFDPYTIPYFSQQYFFRERCWNLELTEKEFFARLQKRLFDADAPKECIEHYWRLSKMAHASAPRKKAAFPSTEQLAGEEKFLASLRKRKWTPRMNDTISRMDEAFIGLAKAQSNRPK